MREMEQRVRERLFAMQDEGYRKFQAGLLPNLDAESVIGVRTPQLRALAKEMAKQPEAEAFLAALPHRYFEENNLHAFLLETIRDYECCITAVEAFLPYIDNWATCDQLSPRVFGRHLPELLAHIRAWINSGQTYTVRFGIGMLMRYYLDGAFAPEYLELVAGVRSDEYYVNMMVAWYFATALAKQYEAALPYLQQHRLPAWTHRRAIQKAVESRRISAEQKEYLRTLR